MLMKIYYESPDMEQLFMSNLVPLCTSGEMQGTADIASVTFSEENWNIFGDK